MNEKLTALALEVGGSHYPEVAKQHLEEIVRIVVRQCAIAHHQTRLANTPIEQHFLKQFGLE
jgi:hypothetical protein